MKTIYFPLFLLFGLIYTTTFAQTYTSFFNDITTAVAAQLTSAEESEITDTAIIRIGSALGYRELVEAEFENVDQIDTGDIADDVVAIIRDALAEDDCDDIFANINDVIPENGRRRRLQDLVALATTFLQLLQDNVYAELSDMEEAQLGAVFSARGGGIISGEGLIALINADCDARELSVIMTSARVVALFRSVLGESGGRDDDDDDDLDDLLTLLLLANAAGDSDDDDSSDDDDGDDARTVNEAKDNLDLDEVHGPNEDETEQSDVVTLKIATSTMTNMWIALIVFCGFNMSLFWFFTARNKKQSVHYETAEEVPSTSVHH